jgi:hypothetical protein
MQSIKPIFKVILASLIASVIVSCNGAGDKTRTTSNEAGRVATSPVTSPVTSNENKAAKTPNVVQSKPGGTIEIESTPPGAAVILIREEDGSAANPERKGSTPVTITGLAAGKYSINLEKPGFKSFEKDVDVKVDKTVKIRASLKHN